MLAGVFGGAERDARGSPREMRGERERESDRRIFQGEPPRGEGRTDALGWTEKRISERRVVHRGRPPQKGESEKDERGSDGDVGSADEPSRRTSGHEGEKDERILPRVGQFSLKISRRRWPRRGRGDTTR